MSLINKQLRTNQALQQVKELARVGKWEEAKSLVNTLPETPDVLRIKSKIDKQIFISTGEVPTAMEGSPALVDMPGTEDKAAMAVPTVTKQKRSSPSVPKYWGILVSAFLCAGIGILAIALGIIQFGLSFWESSYYADAARVSALASFGIGFSLSICAAVMRAFVDIARNTFKMNHLLEKLLDKE